MCGLDRYKQFVESKELVATEYVKMATTFLRKGDPGFLADWEDHHTPR